MLWLKDNMIVCDTGGHPIDCNECPCVSCDCDAPCDEPNWPYMSEYNWHCKVTIPASIAPVGESGDFVCTATYLTDYTVDGVHIVMLRAIVFPDPQWLCLIYIRCQDGWWYVEFTWTYADGGNSVYYETATPTKVPMCMRLSVVSSCPIPLYVVNTIAGAGTIEGPVPDAIVTLEFGA